MQMFGIGIMELMVILVLAALVIGPERLPQFAADLAQWIRRMRAYSQHLMRDFNDVMGDLEKEVGTSREDWKEIASVVRRTGTDVARDLNQVAAKLDVSGDLERAKFTQPASTNGATNGNGVEPQIVIPMPPEAPEPTPAEPEATSQEEPAKEEQPWYVPDAPRRRSTS
jgi:sec-independent protein translocase protein TatB